MREIKFRVFNLASKKMTKPFTLDEYATDQDGEFGDQNFILHFYESPYDLPHQVKSNPLMQFTGLKDKNGKEIYDGDILSHPTYCNFDFSGKYTNDVKWGETGDSDGYSHDKHFEWIVGEDSLADVYEQSEIIGNIYDNPELIKQ